MPACFSWRWDTSKAVFWALPPSGCSAVAVATINSTFAWQTFNETYEGEGVLTFIYWQNFPVNVLLLFLPLMERQAVHLLHFNSLETYHCPCRNEVLCPVEKLWNEGPLCYWHMRGALGRWSFLDWSNLPLRQVVLMAILNEVTQLKAWVWDLDIKQHNIYKSNDVNYTAFPEVGFPE